MKPRDEQKERQLDRSFAAWYGEYHRQLVAVLASAFGDEDLACEVADEALVRAYERWSRVGAMESPAGWTYRVAFNVARRRLRRRSFEQRLLRAEPTSRQEGPAGEMWALVADLPPRQRQAVALRHVAGLTEAGVGAVMGISRGTVSATLRSAYRTLRVELRSGDERPVVEPDLRVVRSV